MTENGLGQLLGLLRRHPDVEASNLKAWDATDSLLLDTASDLLAPDSTVAVIGDNYGALTLGLLAGGAGPVPAEVRVHQDLVTGERALRNNAAALGVPGGFAQLPLGPDLLAGADLVLLQLPRTLAELEEISDAVARHAPAGAVLLAGGRVKHMSLGMNAVLEKYFGTVQPQLARQKSRLIIASNLLPAEGTPPFPVTEHNADLDLDICAHGAVFAGTRLDIGTRFLLTFLPEIPFAGRAVDLGCGTGILAAMYARRHPGIRGHCHGPVRCRGGLRGVHRPGQRPGRTHHGCPGRRDEHPSRGKRQPYPAEPAVPPRLERPRRCRAEDVRGSWQGPGPRGPALDGIQQPPALYACTGTAGWSHPVKGRNPKFTVDGQRQAACHLSPAAAVERPVQQRVGRTRCPGRNVRFRDS